MRKRNVHRNRLAFYQTECDNLLADLTTAQTTIDHQREEIELLERLAFNQLEVRVSLQHLLIHRASKPNS